MDFIGSNSISPAIVESEIKQIVVSTAAFGPNEIKQITTAIASNYTNFSELKESVQQLEEQQDRSPATNARLGVCQYLLGRFEDAIETLSNSDGGALTHFYLAKAYLALDQHEQAVTAFSSSETAGYGRDAVALAKSEVFRYANQPQDAIETLNNLSGAVEQTAEYLYQRAATVASLGGNPTEVVALLERAVDTDGNHTGALFGLALENDRHGNDKQAQTLYEKASAQFPTHVGTLLNLGIIYEDIHEFDRAKACFQRILDVFPNHDRANLFFKDSDASKDMLYDEEAQRREDRMAQILAISVSDFELSVRSRNCLQKMGIVTLGDLTKCTEQELLSSKNFGETSLVEIREMLIAKGLDLGVFAENRRDEEPAYDPESLSQEERALMDRPISDLNLSVRARKCMVRLGIATIGELVRKTQDELLECKNFGVTSLTEVREKIGPLNLKLRGD